MKKYLIWAFILSPFISVAQSQGINFEHGLNWLDVLQKAKAENKYIFVDCYATWCGPCKWMDRSVYANDTAGTVMNDQFLSVKLQMDSTSRDKEEIKNWYATAHRFGEQYHITAYPTYLFFSPDGNVVHKDVGSLNLQGFITLAEAAVDPRKQFYLLLSQYRKGNKNYTVMAYLADAAKKAEGDSLSYSIAADYIHNYLELLPEITLWTKDNVQFIGHYSKIVRSNDGIFRRYFKNRKMIDSLMGSPGYADRFINFVAYNQEVKPLVDTGIKDRTEPNWRIIERIIETRYGHAYVKKNVLKGRIEYYRTYKDWRNYTKYLVRQVENANVQNWPSGYMSITILNNDAFEVFKYSKDKGELKKALSWIDRAIAMNGNADAGEMDTKANLLYKLGRRRDGLALEQKSHCLDPKDKEIETAYNKMKNGLPTWE